MTISIRILALVALLTIVGVVAGEDTAAAAENEKSGEQPGLRNEEDVEKIRAEAIAKLEKPLDKMKVKELKQLLTDRGVVCTACSEKDQLVKTVRESMHLPVKVDHLKKIHMPKQVEDEELNAFIKELKAKQQKENEIKEMLKKQGINTDGMNFGSSGIDAATMESVLKNMKQDKGSDKGSEL